MNADLHSPAGDLMSLAFAAASCGMLVTDSAGVVLEVNDAFCDIAERERGALVGHSLDPLLHPEDKGRLGEAGELRLVRADGSMRWIEYRPAPLGPDEGFVVHVDDVTERRARQAADEAASRAFAASFERLEGRLQRLADQDPLTGLWNRRRFQQELDVQVARSERYGERAAVLMIDLDRFKAVNDTHGHAAGDELLTRVADALRDHLRASDLVARVGGDEFAVLLPHADRAAAERTAAKLVVRIRAATRRLGAPRVSASVGIAVLGTEVLDAEGAMARADDALYRAKRQTAGARE